MIRQPTYLLRQLDEDLATTFRGSRGAALKEGPDLRFEQFDPQAFRRNRHFDLVLELVKGLRLTDCLLQLILDLVHVVLADREVFTRTSLAVSDLFGHSCWILEISANRFANLFTAVQEPEHDKQRHHGRDKIGIGYFPSSAVVSGMPALLLNNNDRTCFSHQFRLSLGGLRRRRLAPVSHGCFGLFEAWTDVTGNCAPAHLDGQHRRDALYKSDHANAQHVIISMLVIDRFRHARRQRTDQSITKKDSKERSDQR